MPVNESVSANPFPIGTYVEAVGLDTIRQSTHHAALCLEIRRPLLYLPAVLNGIRVTSWPLQEKATG
jgi:hypothetical protein